MNVYILLFFAVMAEIIATTALKLSNGFTKLYPTLIVGIGYFSAFWIISVVMKSLPVSVIYAIWCGLGILGIALIGIFYFKEPFKIWHAVGTLFIISGVIILCMVSEVH